MDTVLKGSVKLDRLLRRTDAAKYVSDTYGMGAMLGAPYRAVRCHTDAPRASRATSCRGSTRPRQLLESSRDYRSAQVILDVRLAWTGRTLIHPT